MCIYISDNKYTTTHLKVFRILQNILNSCEELLEVPSHISSHQPAEEEATMTLHPQHKDNLLLPTHSGLLIIITHLHVHGHFTLYMNMVGYKNDILSCTCTYMYRHVCMYTYT